MLWRPAGHAEVCDAGAPRRFAPSPTRLDDTSMVIVTQKHVFSLADEEDGE